MDKEIRDAIQPLMHDIANSEHRLRHPNAFAALAEECGLVVNYSARGTLIRTPEQVEADDAAEKAAAAKAAADEKEVTAGRTTVSVAPARKAPKG